MDWSVLRENAGLLAQGLLVTLEVSALALVLALALGVIVATLRVSPSSALRRIGTAYVEFLRNIPLLVQLFFLYYALPSIGIRLDAFLCGVLALGVYTSAFVAEAIRSGIAAVPKGQLEAGAVERDALRDRDAHDRAAASDRQDDPAAGQHHAQPDQELVAGQHHRRCSTCSAPRSSSARARSTTCRCSPARRSAT